MTSLHARFAMYLGATLVLVASLPIVLYVEVARRVSAGVGIAAVDDTLGALAYSFGLMGSSALLLALAGGLWQLRRATAALQRAGDALDTAEAPPSPTDVPEELAPFVRHLTRLHERLHGALDREREFTGHVAHELRTPLTVLTTGLELVVRKQTPGTAAHAHTRDMLDTVDEMRRLIDNLLLLARVERGAEVTKLEPVAVRPLVDAIWQRLAQKAQGRGLDFDNQLADDYSLSADRPKLRMVLQNLLANAVSYTERGGSVVVSASDTMRLAVWDSGPALSAEQLERVFDRMWRADVARTDAGQHAGIGLSLARALARQMQMDLVACSPADGGVCFALVAVDASARVVTADARVEPDARRQA